MPDRHVTIITYHAIDERKSVISVKPSQFCRQMRLLKKQGIRGINLAMALDSPEQADEPRGSSVVLTFDDGYLSVLQDALPVMKTLGFTGTVFIPTNFVGLSGKQAQSQNADINRDMMDWNHLEELADAGFEVAAHAKSHPDLTRLTPDQLEDEIGASKQCLENHLHQPVLSLAYPYGYYNTKVRQAADRHFRYGCTTELGHNKPGTDRLLLKRIDAYYLDRESTFLKASAGGLNTWWKFRQGMRQIKSLGRNLSKPFGE